jgi:hypothetical protein
MQIPTSGKVLNSKLKINGKSLIRLIGISREHQRVKDATYRVSILNYAANPLCLNRGSVLGSLPRKDLKTSIGCLLPPSARMVSR